MRNTCFQIMVLLVLNTSFLYAGDYSIRISNSEANCLNFKFYKRMLVDSEFSNKIKELQKRSPGHIWNPYGDTKEEKIVLLKNLELSVNQVNDVVYAIEKANKWANINKTEKKSFRKQIIVIQKTNIKIEFAGFNNGQFSLLFRSVKRNNNSVELFKTNSEKELKNIINQIVKMQKEMESVERIFK